MSTVRAKYENGVLTLLEPLDLEEGAEVVVRVDENPPAGLKEGNVAYGSAVKPEPAVETARKALRETAGAWKGSMDPEELKRNIYADRLLNSRPETRP